MQRHFAQALQTQLHDTRSLQGAPLIGAKPSAKAQAQLQQAILQVGATHDEQQVQQRVVELTAGLLKQKALRNAAGDELKQGVAPLLQRLLSLPQLYQDGTLDAQVAPFLKAVLAAELAYEGDKLKAGVADLILELLAWQESGTPRGLRLHLGDLLAGALEQPAAYHADGALKPGVAVLLKHFLHSAAGQQHTVRGRHMALQRDSRNLPGRLLAIPALYTPVGGLKQGVLPFVDALLAQGGAAYAGKAAFQSLQNFLETKAAYEGQTLREAAWQAWLTHQMSSR